uniref:Uncharacterized protein n=1 Tax=Nymphaea colorata TaxID=210225 RepID=A0A5K1H8Q1_9MAGN
MISSKLTVMSISEALFYSSFHTKGETTTDTAS